MAKYKLKAESGKISVQGSGLIMNISKNQFFFSKKRVCNDFLQKYTLNDVEILDFLLSLHLVLEIGVNSFFRSLYYIYSNLEFSKYENLLDDVSFLNKIQYFLSSNRFTYRDGKEVDEAEKLAKQVISDIKNFNEVRNKIVHGHSISEYSGAVSKKSKLLELIRPSQVKDQVERFKKIIDSLNYFVDRLVINSTDISIPSDQIRQFQEDFLSYNFLNLAQDSKK